MTGLSGIFVASLTLLCLKVLSFFPPNFCSETIFDTLSISVHATVGTLIHSPSFQMQLWACINITLTMASIIRISQEKENKDVKGAFSKITTQLQTKLFNNLLQNTINKLKLYPRTTWAQNLLPLIAHTLNRLKINKKVLPPPHPFLACI